MARYSIVIVFLLMHVLIFTSVGWAKDVTKPSSTSRKNGVKNTTVVKRKALTVTRDVKQRSAARYKVKVHTAVGRKQMKQHIAAHAKRKANRRYAHRTKVVRPNLPTQSLEALAGLDVRDRMPDLKSNVALVLDSANSEVLFAKNSDAIQPIASITKLMTALIVVEAGQDMDEILTVTEEDVDRIKHTSSRLRIGARLPRSTMLHIALMSSENRAASALGRNYPGGLTAFVAAMNAKARALEMTDTHYVEPTGLSSQNVSSARDLGKLVIAAQQHPVIRKYSTYREYQVDPGGSLLQYRNSNRLIANPSWNILVQKTGYISEAGRCLVMQTVIKGRSVVMVFLNAKGKFSRASDAGRIRSWLEALKTPSR